MTSLLNTFLNRLALALYTGNFNCLSFISPSILFSLGLDLLLGLAFWKKYCATSSAVIGLLEGQVCIPPETTY